MSRFLKVVIFLSILILAISSVSFGGDYFDTKFDGAVETSDKRIGPTIDTAIHDNGKFGFTVGNNGTIGTGFLNVESSVPSFVYPYPGEASYLFAGALWIGAVIGSDTLVSLGADGWNPALNELLPADVEIIDESSGSLQKYKAIIYDTFTDPAIVGMDPFDNRPHIPLGIKITQTSWSWDIANLEDFVILDYTVENIGQNHLEGVYIGFYVDGDVWNLLDVSEVGNDISGFKATTITDIGNCTFERNINVAWISDIDGRKLNNVDSCTFPAVTGMRVLKTPSDSLNISYNWWASNINSSLDFGPRLAGDTHDPFRDFGTGGLGTPSGDKNKYYIMSHSEIDYDQIFSSIDHTVNGWLSPPVNSDDLADGQDTRYLLSFGPFEFFPGETIPFTMAYIAGDNFHSEPCDAFNNLFNSHDPDPFYNQLNFNDLAQNAMLADWVYDNPGVDTDGDAYLGSFTICNFDSAFVYDTISYDPLVIDSFWSPTYSDTVYFEGDGVPDFDPWTLSCGDVDLSGSINILDLTSLISYLYIDSIEPIGMAYSDLNRSGGVNVLDITFLISYLYLSGPAPECI